MNDGYEDIPYQFNVTVENTFENIQPTANAGTDTTYTLVYDGIPGGCIDVAVNRCGSYDECDENGYLLYT